ncbi:hypothetical protein KFK09_002968 [Dendrobium nobile]|uniref:Uncharacterized protein n=1 Tax=Dendrobium nobile TaxID=94219 RepID=A0A8T3C564_DENNO|nr:hypothetical protein KFK09_002968 [Dendrobium nobile]
MHLEYFTHILLPTNNPYSATESAFLMKYGKHGEGNSNIIPKNIILQLCGKSYHLRWTNYLHPNPNYLYHNPKKKGSSSSDEEKLTCTSPPCSARQ